MITPYGGDASYTYNRRSAAANKSLDWSILDVNLYDEQFVGRAKAVALLLQ